RKSAIVLRDQIIASPKCGGLFRSDTNSVAKLGTRRIVALSNLVHEMSRFRIVDTSRHSCDPRYHPSWYKHGLTCGISKSYVQSQRDCEQICVSTTICCTDDVGECMDLLTTRPTGIFRQKWIYEQLDQQIKQDYSRH